MSRHERGPAVLQAAANGPLRSRVGACFPGSHAIFRGHNLHTELQGMSWFEIYMFGVLGRRLPSAQLQVLEAVWKLTSYPDARIWNNRVAALAGSSRSTGNLAVAGALAVSEASIYGRGIDIRAIDFFMRTRQALAAGASLADCILTEKEKHGGIAGYGRPVTNGDERSPYLLALMEELGLEQGPHLRLAYEVNDFLMNRWQKQMNFAAVVAAVAADFGLSPREYYFFVVPAFIAGMPPCYLEAAEERPEGALYPTACRQLVYEGPAARPWKKK